jgi:hypothetical protein
VEAKGGGTADVFDQAAGDPAVRVGQGAFGRLVAYRDAAGLVIDYPWSSNPISRLSSVGNIIGSFLFVGMSLLFLVPTLLDPSYDAAVLVFLAPLFLLPGWMACSSLSTLINRTEIRVTGRRITARNHPLPGLFRRSVDVRRVKEIVVVQTPWRVRGRGYVHHLRALTDDGRSVLLAKVVGSDEAFTYAARCIKDHLLLEGPARPPSSPWT